MLAISKLYIMGCYLFYESQFTTAERIKIRGDFFA